ncbi:MAG: thioredoxin family protein [Planctomycetota bacterium]|jgi:thioredoxin-related protein
MKMHFPLAGLALLLGLGLVFPVLAQEGSGAKDEGEEPAEAETPWITDFEEAKAAAKAAGKDLLVNFSGSDWCGWCIKLDKEVFSQAEFLSAAKKNFILCNLDFPRKKADPHKEKNSKISQAYGVGGFPTVILLDPQGRIYGRTGYEKGGAASYITHLGTFRDRIPERDKLLAALTNGSGEELTAAIKAAVDKLREWKILPAYSKELTAAIDTKVTATEGAEGQVKELGAFLAMLKGDYKGHGTNLNQYRSLLDRVIALDSENKFGFKLTYLGHAFQSAKIDKDEEGAKKYAELIREADPKNENGLAEVVVLSDIQELFNDKKFADAAKQLEDFLANNTPKDRGDILYWATGLAHMQNGEAAKGVPFMKKLVELYPSSRFARGARNFLARFEGK